MKSWNASVGGHLRQVAPVGVEAVVRERDVLARPRQPQRVDLGVRQHAVEVRRQRLVDVRLFARAPRGGHGGGPMIWLVCGDVSRSQRTL